MVRRTCDRQLNEQTVATTSTLARVQGRGGGQFVTFGRAAGCPNAEDAP